MSKYRPDSSIDEIIIHCSDTPNGRWTTVEDIDRWHGERGFKRDPGRMRYQAPLLKHIGYHFVVYTTGAVVSARGLNETGAHAAGHNTRAIGICMIGRDQFSAAQWQALKQLVTGMQKRFKGACIIGHREINSSKTCPGFDVQAWLAMEMQLPGKHLMPEVTE